MESFCSWDRKTWSTENNIPPNRDDSDHVLIVWCVDESRTARIRAERNGSSLSKLIIAPESYIGGLPGLIRSHLVIHRKVASSELLTPIFANINRDGMSLENSTKFGVNCFVFSLVHKKKLHHLSLSSLIHSDTVNIR
jgi:hypothetical protein